MVAATRCASLSVGIEAYREARYRDSDMRLRFAVSDAQTFHRYARLAWPSPDDRSHFLITDHQATASAVSAAIAALAAPGPLDLFLLYLSGHGEMAGGRGWFCLVDAVPGVSSLDGEALDALLATVEAERVVLFLDCCHAEALTASVTFFGRLDSGVSRLCIGSARRNQKAWEDASLERSIFSDVLLRALSTDSPVADPSGHVDIEAALVPYLREQVPLLAAKNKRGQVQEPVSGGRAASGSRLPTVTSRSLGRPLTIAQTVRARVRRALVSIATVGLVVAGAVELLAFHLAVTGTGAVVVRPGLRWTFSLLPVHAIQEVDTGLTLASFDPAADDTFRHLAAGTLRGLSTHVDDRGLRTWLASIERSLRSGSKLAVQMLATGKLARVDPEQDPAPIVEAAFLARLSGRPISQIGLDIYPLVPRAPVRCTDNAGTRLDFSALNPDTRVFAWDALWIALSAPDEGSARRQALVALVTLAAYRGFHQQEAEIRTQEVKAFAASIEALVAAWPRWNTDRADSLAKLAPMVGTWCALYADGVLALLGETETARAAEARLRRVLLSFDRIRQGDLASPEQAVATTALAIVAARRPLDQETLTAAAAMAQEQDAGIDTPIPGNELLMDAAPTQALPGQFIARLLDAMAAPEEGPGDFRAVIAFKILSRNVRFLDATARAAVLRWAETRALELRTLSDVHEALGFLVVAGFGRAEFIALLDRSLPAASRFPPGATTYRGSTLISSRGDSAAVALGMAARHTDLPDSVIAKLENFAMGRTDVPARAEIVHGLAAHRYRRVSDDDLAAAIAARLAATKHDARLRNLEVETASVRIGGLSVPTRDRALDHLVGRWRIETQPEQRIALARVIGMARHAGVGSRQASVDPSSPPGRDTGGTSTSPAAR